MKIHATFTPDNLDIPELLVGCNCPDTEVSFYCLDDCILISAHAPESHHNNPYMVREFRSPKDALLFLEVMASYTQMWSEKHLSLMGFTSENFRREENTSIEVSVKFRVDLSSYGEITEEALESALDNAISSYVGDIETEICESASQELSNPQEEITSCELNYHFSF